MLGDQNTFWPCSVKYQKLLPSENLNLYSNFYFESVWVMQVNVKVHGKNLKRNIFTRASPVKTMNER